MFTNAEFPRRRDITNSRLREYLGHNGHECRVRIKLDGTVERYGSPNPTDRSRDAWVYVGHRDDLLREMRQREGR